MSAAENKAMVRRVFEEAINAGDYAVLDELLAADYVNHDMPAPAPGAEGFKQVIAQFRAAFPDMTVTIEAEFADGDLVGTRGRFTGTHKGDFMGHPGIRQPYRHQVHRPLAGPRRRARRELGPDGHGRSDAADRGQARGLIQPRRARTGPGSNHQPRDAEPVGGARTAAPPARGLTTKDR